MEKFVIDTNFFFNMEIKSGLGENTKEVITSLTKLVKEAKEKKKADFYMPQSIVNEFLGFFPPTGSGSGDEKPDFVDEFLSLVIIKSPDTAKLEFPARVFYKLVDEIRKRSYRGLQVSEEQVLKGAEDIMGKSFDSSKSKQEFQKTIGPAVTKLRERYRHATRVNFLDSTADLDLIVLAKELNGFLVSSDEGVLRWGRTFGVREIPASLLRQRLVSLLG